MWLFFTKRWYKNHQKSGHSPLTYCIELTTPVPLFYTLGIAVNQIGVKGGKSKRSQIPLQAISFPSFCALCFYLLDGYNLLFICVFKSHARKTRGCGSVKGFQNSRVRTFFQKQISRTFPGLFQTSDWIFHDSKIHINPFVPKISMLILLTVCHTFHIFYLS